MQVLFVASECVPLVKVGGLADVVGGLPKALKKLGVDVGIAIPRYESINVIYVINVITIIVNYAGKQENVKILKTTLPQSDIPVYLFENAKYLSNGPAYSAKSAEGTSLDIDRFSFFSKAVVEFLRSVEKDPSTRPSGSVGMTNGGFDIVHCHDWHTAWIPTLLKLTANSQKPTAKSLLTIHNMGKSYQGRTSGEVVEKLGISPSVIARRDPSLSLRAKRSNLNDSSGQAPQSQSKEIAAPLAEFTPSTTEGLGARNDNQKEINILLQGIINADLINTVSPTYAKEIQTEEYGEDLHDILIQYKDKLTGILNGIDYEVWNPETDKNLVVNYSSNLSSWNEGKKNNKFSLLTKVGLPSGENIPTFGMVTRIAEQKGFEILIPALEQLFNRHSGERSDSRITSSVNDSGQARMTSSDDVRVIILGVGEPSLESRISNLELKYKEKLRFITRFDEALAHLIYAGSDFFLMPSRFEPCGLIQLIAMRYGSLPIVRKTGGLADSVEDGKTGFVFEEYSSEALLKKLEEAMEVYRHSGERSDSRITSSVNDSGQVLRPRAQDRGARMTQFKEMVNSAMQKDFSWDKSAGEYLKLYEKLMSIENL